MNCIVYKDSNFRVDLNRKREPAYDWMFEDITNQWRNSEF